MIALSLFAYSPEQWAEIRAFIHATRGPDAFVNTGSGPLQGRIEVAMSMYRLHSDTSRQQLRRSELDALREKADSLRASIVDAMSVPVSTGHTPHQMLLRGVDADMLKATREYFAKLARNIDRQIEQAEQRSRNSKPDRDECWEELLAIWGDIGGKPRGAAAADFLMLASLPIMGSTVPTFAAVVQWLERRRQKAAKAIAKPAPRRAVG